MKKYLRFAGVALMALVIGACGSKKLQEDIHIVSEADVAGLTVAVQAGSIYDIEMSRREDVKIARYATAPDIVAAIISGQADVFKDDEICMSPSELRRHGLRLDMRCEESFDVAYAFRKDDASTVSLFNAFLNGIRADGTYEQIRHRWFDTQEPDTVSIPAVERFEGARPLKVATHLMLAPISFIKGDVWTGFEIELLQRFAASLGRPLEVSSLAMAGAVAALQSGAADVWAGCIFITEERSQKVLFSEPYYQCHSAYFVRDGGAGKEHIGLWASLKDSFRKNLLEEKRWRLITDGLWETLKIALLALLLGTVLAGGLCWMSMCRKGWIRAIASVYIEIMRGIPLLVILMLMFYVVFAGTGISATAVAVISFALVFAAYVSEIFRSAIEGIGKGQTEAGIALGFTPLQTFIYIVAPQAAKAALPVYKGEAVSLFKNTSIVGYIAIQDLTRASDLIRSRTFDAFFPLILISIIYFVLAWLLGKLLDQTLKSKKS